MRPTEPFAFRVLLLASVAMTSIGAPVAALAQPSTTPASQSGTADAIRVLLDQADYWRSQYQPDRADEALARVLTLDPRNVDALAAQAQAAADKGNQKDARAALAKLQAIRPDDPRIASVQQALQVGPIDALAIGEARQLAQAGKADEAVAAYRKAFKGDVPPPNLAVEFYQTEASTDAGWDAARDGLAALVRSNPQDLRAQLAFAQILTYREGTREDGVDRLATLSQQPSLKAAARKSWRDGLLWSGDDERSQAQLETYLKDNPSDPEIDARRADLKASVPDEGARDRLAGYQAMDSKNLPEAQKNFQAALDFNNQDIEAMVMLAAIDRVHGREADVQRLMAQARAVDPDRAKELIDSVGLNVTAVAQGSYRGGSPQGGSYQGGGDYGAASRRAYANVQQLTNRGEYASAEAALGKLMGKRPPPGSYIQLGYIQLRAGQLSDAEASFRRVLASNPRSVPALNGLAGTLSREGNTADADRIYARLGNRAGAVGLAQTRATSLRDEAHAATNTDDKIRLYRESIAADPSDPWVRLELARVLLDQNKSADAHEVMAPVTTSSKPSIDQLRAGIYFADSSHDYKLAVSLVDRLPPKARTPELRDALVRAEVGADLQDARSAGNLAAMERRMLVLAAKPDPTGARGAAFAKALLQAGDKPGARDVIRAALNASPAPTSQQRIAYAQMLIGAGDLHEAQVVAAGVQPGVLSPVQRSQLTQVQDSSAVGLSDALNNRGRTADAYDQLQPRLTADPDNPDLSLALARLYQSQHQAEKALAIDEALLKDNPSSRSVKTATVFAALSAGKTGRAGELVSELKSEFPDEPETWMAAAQVARARGNNGQALSDLRTAKTLRSKQIETTGSSDAAALAAPGWLPGRRYALNLRGDVANDASPSVAPAEPVTRAYERYAQALPAAPPDDALTAPPEWRRLAAATIDVTGLAPAAVPQDGAVAVLTPVAYNNPFRSSSPTPTQDEPTVPPPSDDGSGQLQQRQPSDPLTADIDRSIQQINAEMAPELDGALILRGRSGVAGQAELLDLESPLSASFSPAGYGRLKVQVTPAYLWADRSSAANQASFGTNPLAAAAGRTITRGEVQTAAGAALDVSYSFMGVTGDIGSTPIGFREASIVGGVEYAPRLTSDLTLRVVGERRAVTDSLLSYAGAKDPLSGQSWGGVTRNRGHIQLEGTVGIANYYVGGGGGVLLGEQVESNTEFDAGAGFSLPVWKTATQEVRSGLDLVYFGYRKNLGAFTIGNGGYFSPQQFFAALIPVSYTDQVTPELSWGVGGSIGVQTFRAKGEPIFPEDSARQAQLEAFALTNTGVLTRASGFNATGPAGGAHAEIDYAITPNLHVGGKVGFDRSGNFTEGTGLVYARYVFSDPQ